MTKIDNPAHEKFLMDLSNVLITTGAYTDKEYDDLYTAVAVFAGEYARQLDPDQQEVMFKLFKKIASGEDSIDSADDLIKN